MIEIGRYANGFAPDTEYGNKSLEELFHMSASNGGKHLIAAAPGYGKSIGTVSGSFMVYPPYGNAYLVDDVMSNTPIIEKLAAQLGQKSGEIQRPLLRRLLLQNDSALKKYMLSENTGLTLGDYGTVLSNQGIRHFRELYWAEYSIDIAEMLTNHSEFMGRLTEEVRKIQQENGLTPTDVDTAVERIKQLITEEAYGITTVERILNSTGIDFPVRAIVNDYIENTIKKSVYTTLTTKNHYHLLDKYLHSTGAVDALVELEKESPNGKIKLTTAFIDDWIAHLVLVEPPFMSLYYNAISYGPHSIDISLLETRFKQHSVSQKLERVLVKWAYSYCLNLVTDEQLLDMFPDALFDAIEDSTYNKLVDDVEKILEESYGFTIQR